MSESAGTTTNTAGAGSTVGIQAEQVHNSTVYQVLPGDPPSRVFEVGVHYLDDGVPSRARELISDAIAHGHDNAEVRFHWALAMLSKRSYRDLSITERVQLMQIPVHLEKYPEDEWKRALSAVWELLEHLDGSVIADSSMALLKLQALYEEQRSKIMRHCDLVLTGGLKDTLWAETRRAAEQGRIFGDRYGRVWAYFQLNPMEPRVRRPMENRSTISDRCLAFVASVLLLTACGYLARLLIDRSMSAHLVAYLGVIAAGYVGTKNGFEWWYRAVRRRSKDQEYWRASIGNGGAESDFGKRVDESFRYYSQKYSAGLVDRDSWLRETHGARNVLRNEIIEVYRESGVPIGRISWLIRYLIIRVRSQWKEGTLLGYRKQYSTLPSTKIWCVASLSIALMSATSIIAAAIREDPLPASGAAFIALVGGWVSATRWTRILAESRRLDEESAACAEELALRTEEHRRWVKKLEDTCPSEREMETWLQCDKAMLIDDALRHYKMAWRDIIAHAIVQTPARSCKRARIDWGPWRYSKYDLHLFLITEDGVRELSRELNFEKVSFDGAERGNFRFDAVSSLRVVESGASNYALELTLTNGPSRTIRISEPLRGKGSQSKEPVSVDESNVSKISLDSAGFAHALHVLEGIAAEGKAWIQRDSAVRGNSEVPIDASSLF